MEENGARSREGIGQSIVRGKPLGKQKYLTWRNRIRGLRGGRSSQIVGRELKTSKEEESRGQQSGNRGRRR